MKPRHTIRSDARPMLAMAWGTLLLAACTATPVASGPAGPVAVGMRQDHAGAPSGYLAADAIPDSLALVPPPPAPGSAALAQDHAVMRAALALGDTPRFAQAARDADLDF